MERHFPSQSTTITRISKGKNLKGQALGCIQGIKWWIERLIEAVNNNYHERIIEILKKPGMRDTIKEPEFKELLELARNHENKEIVKLFNI